MDKLLIILFQVGMGMVFLLLLSPIYYILSFAYGLVKKLLDK